MKIYLIIILLFYSCLSWAEDATAVKPTNFYVDISYEGGSIDIPEAESSFLKALFGRTKTNVVLIVGSLYFKEKESNQKIFVTPPQIIEQLRVKKIGNNHSINGEMNNDINFIKSHFQSPSQELYLQIDFYSVDESSIGEVTGSIKTLSNLYTSVDPVLSKAVNTAFDLVGTFLNSNKEIKLKYTGGIDLNADSEYVKTMYFYKNGDLRENMPTQDQQEDQVATIGFTIKPYQEKEVWFNVVFPQQTVDKESKRLYRAFMESPDNHQRLETCEALYNHLKSNNTDVSADKLIAIAIQAKGWAQNQYEACLDSEKAKELSAKHSELNKIYNNCNHKFCMKSLKLVNFLDAKISFTEENHRKLSEMAEGTDMKQQPCFKTHKPQMMSRWNKFEAHEDQAGDYHFMFTMCVKTEQDNLRFFHKFTWDENKIRTYTCEQSSEIDDDQWTHHVLDAKNKPC